MQRWNFLDANARFFMETTRTSSGSIERDISTTEKNRPWTFTVVVNFEILPGEQVAITGSCESLGEWQPGQCIRLDCIEGTNKWAKTINIPERGNIRYRYLICAVDPTNDNILVRKWETHIAPRSIPLLHPPVQENEESEEREESTTDLPIQYFDIFGDVKGVEKIDRGWLTSETIIQLKFFNSPFIWKQRLKKRLLYVKVTPMSIQIGSDAHPLQEDSQSNDTKENAVDSTFGFSEVTSLKYNNSELKSQPQFGWPCAEDDLVLFNMTVSDPDNTAFLVDLYAYSTKASLNEPPMHLGYHYIMPNSFKRAQGLLDIPVTCATKHRPMGMMHLGYLMIKPFKYHATFDMETTYQRYWNPKWTGLDVGHRGSGTSFKANKDTVIRENTIASLKNAVQHGADMVEFDVQLSKDLVPVIYHDFNVYVSLKSKNFIDGNDFMELPMRDLSLDQLKKLKVYHTQEGRTGEERKFHNDDLHDSQPFPQLADVLDAIDPHVGFNVEIKWSQELADGKMEEELAPSVDRNLYIDCILETVFRKGGKRRIVFSCFDPDICTMLRYKQNRYPVMFLTLGVTTRYQRYKDPRCNYIENAVCHARAMELLGIVAHTEDLLRDPNQVTLAKNQGLIVFCWGDDNNSQETIKLLKQLGLHAIIYDKMEVHNTKEVKESVFLVARGSNSDMRLQAQAKEPAKKKLCIRDGVREGDNIDSTPNILLLEKQRENLALSTATSLESMLEEQS